MASTIHEGVNTSPWSATRCLDLTRLMGRVCPASSRSAGLPPRGTARPPWMRLQPEPEVGPGRPLGRVLDGWRESFEKLDGQRWLQALRYATDPVESVTCDAEGSVDHVEFCVEVTKAAGDRGVIGDPLPGRSAMLIAPSVWLGRQVGASC